jgi:class 3 adenylate cyclase
VTVLFIDIVESTRWIWLLGDRRWLDLQEQHETMTREAVRQFHGHYLRSTGDGFVVTFGSCKAALLAALSIVEQTRDAFGLDVRAALHFGECEIRGRRAGGVVFHICARIIAYAQAGEILVSRAAREVAPTSAATFVDRGTYALKGLPGEWELYGAERCEDENGVGYRPSGNGRRRPAGATPTACELSSCACAG